jgi:hypothetical protein
MIQVDGIAVGTGFHVLKLAFVGKRIVVVLDGTKAIDTVDPDMGTDQAPASGGITLDSWVDTGPVDGMDVDYVSVSAPPSF